MKRILREVLLIMGLLSIAAGLIGCGTSGSNGKGRKAVDNESGVTQFSYSYSTMRSRIEYTVEKAGDKVYFIYEDWQYEDYGEMKLECDGTILDQLEDLYKTCRLAEWDGFSKSNKNVLDGDMFSLSITFGDGESMHAGGSNATPERFGEFDGKAREILDPYIDRILEIKREEKIAEGISGELTSIMVNFTQHGASGSDQINVLIQKESIRENNFSVTIKSVSGDYFEKGEKNILLHVADPKLGFEDIRKMIDDCGIINWYAFDKAAEDYNNCEWFQVSFAFDDGMRISACGTEHPEHYDEFRDTFLKWLAGKIVEVEKERPSTGE